jgi:glycosyltransferase involved in cell wall biosynthesis
MITAQLERRVDSRTRVLFVIYGLAPAGPERRILDFARAFPHGPDPIDVHVCVVGDDLTLLDEFQKTDAKLLHVPIRRAYLEWRSVQKIVDYIGAHDIQVINSFNLKTLLICAAAKLRYGSRVKLVHHLISLWEDVPAYGRTITWGAMRAADHILCNGHAVKEHLIGSRTMAVPVSVIPNGVDCDHFCPVPELRAATRARLGFPDGAFVLGTVGNVRPVKNYPFLLQAMAELAKRAPDARLLCVGGGPQLEEMKGLAHSLGLAERVVFTGSARDVRPFLAAMDAFALCSLQEGNPNVVLQAMATGLPVVSVRVGEVPFVIEDGASGLLVRPGDGAAFLAAITTLVGDAAQRRALGDEARRRVTRLYSSSQMIDRYATLMQQAAAAPVCSSDAA